MLERAYAVHALHVHSSYPSSPEIEDELRNDMPYLLGCVHDTSIVAMLERRTEGRRSNCENEAPVETLQQKE